MRICSPQLGLSPKSVLGGEVFDREILLGLARKRIKIEIILPRGLIADKNIKNWHITRLPIRRIPAFLFNFLVIPYLFIIYNKSRFQILRLHSPKYIGLGALIFKLFNPKIKIVATYHQFPEANLYGFGRYLNKFWDYIITDSIYVKNKIIKQYKVDASKIDYVHNGVPKYLSPNYKDKSLLEKYNLENKFVLLYMGLLESRKNPLFLLDVVKNCKRNISNITLIYWGVGPLKAKIEEKIKKLGLENNILFLSPKYGKTKMAIHNLADAFVHPSISEGFALAPLEAMACAKPIIISRGYSASEAVDNKINGFICKQNDLTDWCDKIQKLYFNQAMRVKMGNESLLKVKNEFQWRFTIDKHIEICKNIVKTNTM